MSTCSDNLARSLPIPIRAFEYPSVLHEEVLPEEPAKSLQSVLQDSDPQTDVVPLTQDDIIAAYERGRDEGIRTAEAQNVERVAQAISAERSKVEKVVQSFHESTAKYYSELEEQAVHLSLAIAAKILHRESQVDPMLVAALVKVATENIRQDSSVKVHIHPSEVDSWRRHFERDQDGPVKIELVADPKLVAGDCIVHSEVGSAALGISAQLREIERGLFDLLAQRPKND